MSLPQRGGPDFSFAGFLVIAAFGALLWKNVPLESSRPTSETEGWYEKEQETIPARLWQDPFRPVYLHEPGEKSSGDQRKDAVAKCNLTAMLPQELSAEAQIKVLAVMVTMGSNAEIEERRRRRRYAVVSGLGEAGYVPETADAIQLCLLSKLEGVSQLLKVPYEWYRYDSPDAPMSAGKWVLLLWLDESRFAERPLGRLRDIFGNLIDPAFNTAENASKSNHEVIGEQPETAKISWQPPLNIFVLGPARSETLRRLAERLPEILDKTYFESLGERGVGGFHILSPFATVPPAQLIGPLESGEPVEKKVRSIRKVFSPVNCEIGSSRHKQTPCVSFLRTVQSDDALAKVLVEELKRREVRLDQHHIALISEWDTHFGRTLPRAFAKALCNNAHCPRLDEFTYLRGIDGRTPLIKHDSEERKSAETSSSRAVPLDAETAAVRRPAGTGQFDYLRRLAVEVKVRDGRYIAEGSGRIRAIGVLGSDVYDKLLLLRALRPEFPGVLFFTTDLDTQLLHPADFRWTRNLIVASGFGLRLHEDLQRTTPPFRDSYQTSAFLATRLATDGDYPSCEFGRLEMNMRTPLNCISQNLFYDFIPPLLFEIGKSGSVQLPAGSGVNGFGNDRWLHPNNESRAPWATVIALFFIGAIGIVVIHQLKPATGWLIISLAAALLGALGLVSMAVVLSKFGEPLSFTEGVSIWPTELLRYVALCLTILFIIKMFWGDKINCGRLGYRYFGAEVDLPARHETLGELAKRLAAWIKGLQGNDTAVAEDDCRRDTEDRAWIAWVLVVVVLGIVGMLLSVSLADKMSRLKLVGILIAYWGVVVGGWLYLVHTVLKVKSINAWATETVDRAKSESTRKKRTSAADYWGAYCSLGMPRERCIRALVMWLLYMSFASLMFALAPAPVTPCRGTAACNIDKGVLVLSVQGMLFLIFLTLDALRLCIYWIKGLYIDNLNWKNPQLEEIRQAMHISESVAMEWTKIQLIAERTDEIGKLIHYPFAIIILMLLSRNSYFDNWGLPPAIAIVVIINIALIIAAGLKLRREAEKVRKESIHSLQEELVSVAGVTEEGKSGTVIRDISDQKAAGREGVVSQAQIETLIQNIRSIRVGAFQSLLDEPLVRAGFVLLGAIGLTVGELATLFS